MENRIIEIHKLDIVCEHGAMNAYRNGLYREGTVEECARSKRKKKQFTKWYVVIDDNRLVEL